MLVNLLEQRQRVGDERNLRGLARAATVTAIVHQIDRAIRERDREITEAPVHGFAVAAEIEKRLRPFGRAHRHLDVDVVDRQDH